MSDMQAAKSSVLIVDDNDIIRRVAVRALERGGFEVLISRDGAEALALAKSRTHPIDLVLTDILLPEKNGPEVFREITRLHPKSAVLYMSGYPLDMIEERGLLPAGSPFIEKTFSSQSLLEKVKETLQNASSSPTL